ncbi:hypothetical protein ACOME3_006707 [Neoechinorhynchus agilis]
MFVVGCNVCGHVGKLQHQPLEKRSRRSGDGCRGSGMLKIQGANPKLPFCLLRCGNGLGRVGTSPPEGLGNIVKLHRETRMPSKRLANIKDKSIEEICCDLRENLDEDYMTVIQAVAKRNLRELLIRPVTVYDILNWEMFQLVEQMASNEESSSINWFLRKLRIKFKGILEANHCRIPKYKKYPTVIVAPSTRKRQLEDTNKEKEKRKVANKENPSPKRSENHLCGLYRKIRMALDGNFKVENTKSVSGILHEVLQMNPTMAEIRESKLIRILYRIKQNEDNAILEHLIKQVASKLKSVFENEKTVLTEDIKQDWTDAETKKRTNEEHQRPISRKVSGVQDQSFNELMDTSTGVSKSTIAKPSEGLILRRRLMNSLDSSYKIINGARAKNIFEDILKEKVSLHKVRKARLIDLLSAMLENDENTRYFKIMNRVAIKIKEKFQIKRSKNNAPNKTETLLKRQRTDEEKGPGDNKSNRHSIIDSTNIQSKRSEFSALQQRLLHLLDNQRRAKSVELTNSVLSEMLSCKMNPNEVIESGLINILFEMANNESNAPLMDMIGTIGLKITELLTCPVSEAHKKTSID